MSCVQAPQLPKALLKLRPTEFLGQTATRPGLIHAKPAKQQQPDIAKHGNVASGVASLGKLGSASSGSTTFNRISSSISSSSNDAGGGGSVVSEQLPVLQSPSGHDEQSPCSGDVAEGLEAAMTGAAAYTSLRRAQQLSFVLAAVLPIFARVEARQVQYQVTWYIQPSLCGHTWVHAWSQSV